MMEESHVPSFLLVDDDETFRERLGRAFRTRGFEVRTAANSEDALRLSGEESAEFAVLDLRMPGGSGLDLLRELKRIDPSTRCMILTGYGSIATTVDAMKLGAVNYLPKPADADDIIRAFERGEASGAAPVPESHDESPAKNGSPSEKDTIKAPSLARAEWEHIHRVLADCDNNISEAARRLGIHRRSLQRKLQKFAP